MKVFIIFNLLTVFTLATAHADSLLRIKCDDKDVGAEVYVNDKYVGECPVTPPAPPGIVTLSARKVVNSDYERLYSKQIRVIDGVPQVIEIVLSAPQMTEDAKRRKEIEEFTAKLSAAENGDIKAMTQVAESFDKGIGVKQNPEKALSWRVKAGETAKLQRLQQEKEDAEALLKEANSGNVSAMREIADRYERGVGVVKNNSEAQAWSKKANEREVEVAAEERDIAKNVKLQEHTFFKNTPEIISKALGDRPDFLEFVITGPFATVAGLVADIVSTPIRTTELQQIQNEASLRPSTWGRPDSMIAKASMLHKAD